MFTENTNLVKGGTYETFVEDVSFWMENKLLDDIDGDIDDEIQRFLAFIPYMVSTFYTKTYKGSLYRYIDILDGDVENAYECIDEIYTRPYAMHDFDQYRWFEDYYEEVTGDLQYNKQTIFMCVLSCCTIAIFNKAKLNEKFDKLPEDEKEKFTLDALNDAELKKKILDKLAAIK